VSSNWPDLAGRIEGRVHILPVRVYFEDTDFAGIVYHANYLKFIERGRSDFIRLLGIHHQALKNPEDGEAAVFVVRRIEMDYLRPAKLDDVLVVETICSEIGGASLTLTQEVKRDGVVLVRAKVVVVLISESGKPQRIGKMIRGALSDYMESGEAK